MKGEKGVSHFSSLTLRHRLVLVGFGVLLGVLLAELVLHLFGAAMASTLPGYASLRLPSAYSTEGIDSFFTTNTGVLMFDPDLGWVTSPGYRAQDKGWYRRHNRAGLRADREYTPTPGTGVRRVAAYGDSFTYCSEVNLEQCWTRRLEEMLANTEVLNFGVTGYGPDQAWLRYRRDGAPWKPCVVLIGHMVENIERVVNRFRPFLAPADGALSKPRFILEGDQLRLLPSPVRRPDDIKDHGWVEANLGPHDAWYFPGILMGSALDRLELVRLTRAAIFRRSRQNLAALYQPGSEALEVLTRELVGFADDVRQRGATPVVLVFPTEDGIADERDGRRKLHAPLLDRLARYGLPAIDFVEALGRQAHSSTLDELVKGHYRPLGNEIVARVLADALPGLTANTCAGALSPAH